MRSKSIAFMAKLGWRLIIETKDLWARVLQGKFVEGNVEIQKLMRKQISSNSWKGIVIGEDVIKKGRRSRILNGKNTLFLGDIWVGDLPLIDLTLKDLRPMDSLKTMSHHWNDATDWKMDALDGMLPPHILDKLGTILVRPNEEGHDWTWWGLSNDGRFSLKSAYYMLKTQMNTSIDYTSWENNTIPYLPDL